MAETNKHLIISEPSNVHNFTSKRQMGGEIRVPNRNRTSHSEYISRRLQEAWDSTSSTTVAGHSERSGIYLEFKGKTGYDLTTKSLEDMRSKKIRLCNIREEVEDVVTDTGEIQKKTVKYATVFVPNDKRQYFSNKVSQYATEYAPKSITTDKVFPLYEAHRDLIEPLFVDINNPTKLKIKTEVTNEQICALSESNVPNDLISILKLKPKNLNLIQGIEDVKKAIVSSLWIGQSELIPTVNAEWCEVWLRSDSEEVENEFNEIIAEMNLPMKDGRIKFPERIIKLIKANGEDLEKLLNSFGWIAELRKAKTTATFWIEQSNKEQAEWVEHIKEKLEIDTESLVSVCILDTGVNNGHPLLSDLMSDTDKHSFDPNWGTHDHHPNGHGTAMAGLAAYGDLEKLLENDENVRVDHLLESCKMLPPSVIQNDPDLWGYITKQCISRAEIQSPDRKRIICLAITSSEERDQGNPSSWSGALDQIISGTEDEFRRIIVVSAGNYTCNSSDLKKYPEIQVTDSLHDPAQSWNAISVGAYTLKNCLTEESLSNFSPIAASGQLSPFTTTSFTWEKKWPIKPEVLFEGGNAAIEEGTNFVTQCDDLSLLTTNFEPQRQLFTSFNMTSAATAQAANFAAQVQVQYPEYWPETIRALMIHSAEWSEELKAQFPESNPDKKVNQLLKAAGYGIPNLERALYCGKNTLTLVSQAEIQPYEEVRTSKGKQRKTKDMHFYNLPWPKSVLEELGETDVEMRITLSYYVEPCPSQIGWKDRYRYPSHLLRFDINSPGESESEFLARVNAAMLDEDDNVASTPSASGHWIIGSQNRDKGSIHSDIWKGTAVELSASNLISVFPRIGWWKERHHLGKFNSLTRYSLIVSIKTPEENIDIDIYTPVANQIRTPIEIEVNSIS